MYVDILRKAEKKSVTIAVIGFPMNIRNLLRNYHELFEEKVKEVYWMNGFYNFGCAVANDGWHGMLGPVNDCRGSA